MVKKKAQSKKKTTTKKTSIIKVKPKTIRRGGPLKKVIRESILKELTKVVESGNIMGVTHQHLADKFSIEHDINIKRQTIANILDSVYKSIPVEDINNTKVKIQVMFDKVFREAQSLLQNASNNREKKEAIDLLLRCMDRFTIFLESFGIKEKVAENINLQADIRQKQVIVNVNLQEDNGSSKAIDNN